MKKRLLLYLFMTVISLGCLTSCDDDEVMDDREATSGEYWEGLSGTYRGKMYAEIDGVPVDTMYQQVEISSDNRNRMNLAIRSLTVDDMQFYNILFSDAYFYKAGNQVTFKAHTVQNMGLLTNITLDAEGVINGGSMQITIVAASVTIRPITLMMKAEKTDHVLNTEAFIKKVTLNHPLVIGQPQLYMSGINGNYLNFYVPDTLNMDSTSILVCPKFELADGATISFPDSVADFSKMVTYTVWAEDSIHRTIYHFIWSKAMIQKYDCQWEYAGVYDWDEPAKGWATNNGALNALMQAGKYQGDYAVKRVKGMNVGEWAAEMTTVWTGEGDSKELFAGSFFQGTFDQTMAAPLYGPQYGVASMAGRRPYSLKGYYKYSPGQDVYVGKELYQDTVKLNDTCCIRAILFEVVNPEDVLDSLNYMNDPRVIAVAEMKSQAGVYQPEYREFSIYFEYIRSYTTARRYKVALICSPSRDIDKKRGAPGSRLTVGGIEIMFSR